MSAVGSTQETVETVMDRLEVSMLMDNVLSELEQIATLTGTTVKHQTTMLAKAVEELEREDRDSNDPEKDLLWYGPRESA